MRPSLSLRVTSLGGWRRRESRWKLFPKTPDSDGYFLSAFLISASHLGVTTEVKMKSG